MIAVSFHIEVLSVLKQNLFWSDQETTLGTDAVTQLFSCLDLKIWNFKSVQQSSLTTCALCNIF